jgi:hypothetical protein
MVSDHPHGSMQRGLSNGPDGDEVAILHRPHVVDVEGDKRLSFAGGGDELNLQTIGLVHLHDGPQSPLRRPCSDWSRSSTTVSRSLYIMSFPPGMQLSRQARRARSAGSDRLGRGSSGVEGCRRHPESLAQPLDVLSCKPSLPSEDLRNDGLSPKLLGEIVLA